MAPSPSILRDGPIPTSSDTADRTVQTPSVRLRKASKLASDHKPKVITIRLVAVSTSRLA